MYRAVALIAIVGLAFAALACNGDPAANPAAPDTAGSTAQAIGQKKPKPPDDPPVVLYDYLVEFTSGMSGSATGITNENWPKNSVSIPADGNGTRWLDFSAVLVGWPEAEVCFGNNLENVTYLGGDVMRFFNNGDASTWPFAVRHHFEARGKDPNNSRVIRYKLWLNGPAGQLLEDEWVPGEDESVTLQFYSWDISLVKGPKNLACERGSENFPTSITVTNTRLH